jgi:hypothetical protein
MPKNLLIHLTACAASLLLGACAHREPSSPSGKSGPGHVSHDGHDHDGPHTKDIGIPNPTPTSTPTPGQPLGYLVVNYGSPWSCGAGTWSINGGTAYPMGPTPRSFTIGRKTLTVRASGFSKTKTIYVLDDQTQTFRPTCVP